MKFKENDFKVQNEAQLLEEKARLIMEKQNLEEQSNSFKNALKDFEIMKIRHTQLVEENGSLLAKVSLSFLGVASQSLILACSC